MKKMDTEKKVKLIYSGELILIALVALVIGVLKLVGIIDTKPVRLLVYNIISLIGAVLYLGNFIWALVSKTKRAKSCMLDMIISLPALLYIAGFDIYCFIVGKDFVNNEIVKYSVGLVLIYLAVDYIFQGIYHYFVLNPQLKMAIEEELENEKQKLTPENSEEITNQDSQEK